VTAPEALQTTSPEYTSEAKLAGLQGFVDVAMDVDEDGNVRDPRIDRTLGLGLDEKVLEALTTWKFKPGLKEGLPVRVPISAEVTFRMEHTTRWILARAAFNPPDGVSRPTVIEAPYPTDLGSNQLRMASISFDVGEDGFPFNLFQYGPNLSVEGEIRSVVSRWRFRPGMKNGTPVPVRCTLEFFHVGQVVERTPRSIAHYNLALEFFAQRNYQSAANEFREALNGDLAPRWIEVWSHLNLGKIFDATGQRERALNEYRLAVRTHDDTRGALNEAATYAVLPYKPQCIELSNGLACISVR